LGSCPEAVQPLVSHKPGIHTLSQTGSGLPLGNIFPIAPVLQLDLAVRDRLMAQYLYLDSLYPSLCLPATPCSFLSIY
jgi:hypothetical protein